MKVPNRAKISLHEHALLKAGIVDEPNWACNGIQFYKAGCYNGIESFGEHEGIRCWRCAEEDCDIDLCEKCVKFCLWSDKQESK